MFMQSVVQMLSGAILPDHWARFQLYAERIRIATATGKAMAEIHSSVWPFLAAKARGAPLMPRLRKFTAYYFGASGLSALSLLLPPTLRHLEILFDNEFDPEKLSRTPHVSATLLQTLPQLVPDLEHFTWGVHLYLADAAYLQFFVHFKQLKSLSAPDNFPLNESNLRLVSSITSLQSLSCLIDLSGVTAPAFPPHAFQRLTSLALCGHSDHLVAFILACGFPNLEHTKFQIVHPPSSGKPRHLSTALCQRLNPTLLTSFEARYTHAFPMPPSSLMDYFEPLLAFPNVTSVDLAFLSTEPCIRDDDLARFGAAWPQLATFRIEHNKRYSQPQISRPTLPGLIALARRCPRLTTLYIPELDPSPMPEKSAIPALGHGLRSVWIDSIVPPFTLQVCMDVATAVDRVFPCIDFADPQILRYSVPGKSWVEVLRFVRAMRIGRENGVAYADMERQES
uniref:Atg26p n=1 Tax=Ganoderma boninense TaxID=34458 RepID=A0A5K1JS92_9APHY|nr:Atg26p [Ganoderma boninense]